MPPAAIVLAAGHGRRMGGPKALLVVDGEPLISRHVTRLREVGCRPIMVVVRSAIIGEVEAILGHFSNADVRIVVADTTSPAASLQIAMRSLTSVESANPIIVTPVDLLPARRATIASLLAAFESEAVRVATPRHRGRGGHPVVVRASLLATIGDDHGHTLRDVIRAAGDHRHRIDVDDAAVLGDLDTPRDVRVQSAGPNEYPGGNAPP